MGGEEVDEWVMMIAKTIKVQAHSPDRQHQGP